MRVATNDRYVIYKLIVAISMRELAIDPFVVGLTTHPLKNIRQCLQLFMQSVPLKRSSQHEPSICLT